MTNVDYDYYRTFHEVARCRSLTRAAAALGNNQPNVSRTLDRLERQLGCRLFARGHGGVVLTPEGERLETHVAVALEQLREGEAELADRTALAHGTVSLGASETALRLFLLEKLRAFHARHPEIRLRISNHSTPQAIAALGAGAVDFAVVTTPTDAGRPFVETPLLTFREIPVAGRAFKELCGRRCRLKDLARLPLVCLGRGTMTYEFYARLFLRHGLVLAPDTEAATADQVLPLVEAGLGVGFVPESSVREALRRGHVFRVDLVEAVPPRCVCLITDPRHPLGAAARALADLLTAP